MTNLRGTRAQGWTALRRTHHVRRRERSHGLVLLRAGKSCPERAPLLDRDAVRRCPRELGYHLSLWTTTLVRHCMYTRVGLESCRKRVRQLRPELGFRLRRLRHRHLRATSPAQAACVAGLRALLEDWPDDTAWPCVDEATGRRQPPLTARWCVVDAGADGPTGDAPSTVHLDGAVAPLTGRTHDHLSQELSRGECAAFLRQLLTRNREQRRLVSHDRAGQQHGTAVEAIVQDAKGRLPLQAQPADAPELHPEARLWKWRRRVVTHHHWLNSLGTRIEAIRHFSRSLAGVTDQGHRWCG